MASVTCIIPPNPDIAGIGVRISIYIQAATALLPAALKIVEDLFNDDVHPQYGQSYLKTVVNWENMQAVATPDLVLGYSLFVSSIVQALTIGLTVYHAVILLNLHLVIAISITPLLILSPNDEKANDKSQRAWKMTACFLMGHVCCAAAFGLWLFSTVRVRSFDRFTDDCESQTFYNAIVKIVNLDNPNFRRFWLGIYSILVIPGVNMGFLFLTYFVLFAASFIAQMPLALLISNFLYCTPWNKERRIIMLMLSVLFFAALTPAMLIMVATERTIAANHVGDGERQWTFGQTFAVFVAIYPLMKAGKQLKATLTQIRNAGKQLIHNKAKLPDPPPIPLTILSKPSLAITQPAPVDQPKITHEVDKPTTSLIPPRQKNLEATPAIETVARSSPLPLEGAHGDVTVTNSPP
ncbi:hypothetical protein BD410DRAFT_447738 [Rickenella mellea]|uniref:Uncharacterized protein n=1 Tax=Rickenella mellea TaxID=50990 RepID=A0A4Y7PX65_9AGAM|nr:hypothetical protein BD410DRAFT_447738 [Rickenella mellea]